MSSSAPVFSLGLDLGGTKLEAALFDSENTEVWRQRSATPANDYAATVALIAAAVAAARQAAAGQAISVGMGTPGCATPQGLMKNCNSTCINGRPLQSDVESAIGQPIRIANDANCLALSEATDGAGAGAEVVFAAILGTGTGAGICVRGQLLTGPNGLSGEWGHNPMPWAQASEDPSFDCYCGRQGCIETLVSGPGLAREHGLRHGGNFSAVDIAERARAGDTDCQATLARHAQRLARALASVINLLDPDVIVLGGGLSALAHLYRDVPALWSRWVFSAGADAPPRTRLLPARHGDASGVRGAAWLWREA